MREALANVRVGRRVTPAALPLAVLLFAIAWVAYKAFGSGFGVNGGVADWIRVTLAGLTLAGLYFVIASGFTLIFGLMRIVNMAHGSLYLLGAYAAFEFQTHHVVSWAWGVVISSLTVGVGGLVMHQIFLRWNQGQELRQALITIAISVIVADQVIAHFHEGLGRSTSWPGSIEKLVDTHIAGVHYSLARLTVLALGVAVGVGLWLWLYRTKTGMVIRAGVDDQRMTSALGINIQRTFAIAFVVGSALAAVGAVVWASQSNIATGQDAQWLLNSLVVVIVGGMGSIFGAAAGAILYAFVQNFSATYLPTTGVDCCTQYSPIFTFVLIALVLAFRPRGLFGRGG